MAPSRNKVTEFNILRKARWFGSFRVLSNESLRYSPWSYLDAPHLAIKVASAQADVILGGLTVMYLYLERNRIASACFVALLKPEQLRTAVAALRNAGPGLNSWVVPALEFNYGWSTVRADPEMSSAIRELLASCRDLPVARQWQRVRAQYFINQQVDPPVLPAVKDTPGGKPRGKRPAGKATTPSKPRKASRGRGSQRD